MSFELNGVLWAPRTEVATENLQPILSTRTDFDLAEEVVKETGLESTGYSIGYSLFAEARSFKTGRAVITQGMNPELLGSDLAPTDDEPSKWFVAAEHVIRLAKGTGMGCYGMVRPIVVARIFGPEA